MSGARILHYVGGYSEDFDFYIAGDGEQKVFALPCTVFSPEGRDSILVFINDGERGGDAEWRRLKIEASELSELYLDEPAPCLPNAILIKGRKKFPSVWFDLRTKKRIFPVWHTAELCGEIAFYTKRKWKPGDAVLASDVIMPDGSTPEPYTDMICGACGSPVRADWGLELSYEKPEMRCIPDVEIRTIEQAKQRGRAMLEDTLKKQKKKRMSEPILLFKSEDLLSSRWVDKLVGEINYQLSLVPWCCPRCGATNKGKDMCCPECGWSRVPEEDDEES
jgi:hypothetical protein